MTALGVAMIASVIVSDVNPTVALIGMMLVVAGVVKVVIVRLWTGVAAFGGSAETGATPNPRKE